MTGPDCSARRKKLIRLLKTADVDALLVTGETNVRYLTGFTGDSSWLYVSSGATVLISDARYTTQIAQECPGLDVHIRGVGQSMTAAAAGVMRSDGADRPGVEGDHLSVSQHRALENQCSPTPLTVTRQLTESLRVIKDRFEIGEIRRAIRQAERAIGVIRAAMRPEQTETEIRYALEASLRDFGAAGPAFEPIVGVGPTAALPHAHAGVRRVSESPLLLIDWGAATCTGYRSDLSRVFVTGKATQRMRRVWDTVLRAQKAAIDRIRPGAVCRDVDEAARGIIRDAGYGKRFGHALGHGIGLDIHEAVRLGPQSDEVLRPGMIVTVEPGIYVENQFGIRIEDDVLVTRDGCQVLTSVPREFDEAVLDFLA